MPTVNMFKAKSTLSQLVEAIESGAEPEIIIARNGKPAAKLVPVDAPKKQGVRIGLYDGKFPSMSLEDMNASDPDILKLFGIEE
jgi:antitoxin (DNA-binding transcriptional repressor) of toxin-antitoxin stability system